MTNSPIDYAVSDRIATITLNRPDRLNAIDDHLPGALEEAVGRAERDDAVHVIILTGAGRSFCSGYDLTRYAEQPGSNPGVQDMPWDPVVDYRLMSRNTRCFMALANGLKPTIAKVRGYAVAGGSDIALCCDLLVMAEDAKIGYPPARVWGCPTTAMWAFRVGAQQAKRLLFTGELIDGKEAQRIGLALEAVPGSELDARVQQLALRMAGVPKGQLAMHKMLVNHTMERMGLSSSQMLATLFDGMARHSPAGMAFKARAETVGFQQAVRERDSGDPIPER
jgi:enoyl-CoA hydratase